MPLFTPFTSTAISTKLTLVAGGLPAAAPMRGETNRRVDSRKMFPMTKPEAPSVQRRKALLVGAEPSVQRLISTFLHTMGWTCTVIQNKEETPAILQREAFDVVVIDLGRSEAEEERTIL